MLAIFERYFQRISQARSDAEIGKILQGVADQFGFRSAFLIEYAGPIKGRHRIIDSNPDRAGWWEEYFDRNLHEMPFDTRVLFDTLPLIELKRDRAGEVPPELWVLLERYDMAELTVVPIRHEGGLVGSAGFCGIAQLAAAEAMALQLIAFNLFAQTRSFRNAGVKTTPATLTPREREVLSLSAEGLTSQQIAVKLGMSARTVNQHVDNVAGKLGTRNRAHTVAEVIRHGLLN
jgi:DNA-binding CsgD family transcriptional regulator